MQQPTQSRRFNNRGDDVNYSGVGTKNTARVVDRAIDLVLCAICLAPSTCLLVTLQVRSYAWSGLRHQLAAADAVLTELRASAQAPYFRRGLGVILQIALGLSFVFLEVPPYVLAWDLKWYVIPVLTTAKIYALAQILVYVNIVMLMRDMFAEVNKRLERELNGTYSGRLLLAYSCVGSDSRKLLSVDNEGYIQRLQMAHLYLSHACDNVNAIFGPCLLFTFAFSWGILLNVTYSWLVGEALYAVSGFMSLWGHLHHCAMSAASVVAVCALSAGAAAEARRTAALLTCPLARQMHFLTPVRRLRLQLFLQQVRDGPARFRCCDVVDADLPFMTSFTATLLGYLVILVQNAGATSLN